MAPFLLVPGNSISLRDIPKISPMPLKEMSRADQTLMREWVQERGKAVQQRTVRQCTTKLNAGTLPLNMYEKELHIGDRVTFDSHDLNTINFLSRSIRTCSGRVICLSHQALASYQWTNTFFRRSSAATLLCLWFRSPFSGFSHHGHQSRPLFAMGLGTLYYNNTTVIYWLN